LSYRVNFTLTAEKDIRSLPKSVQTTTLRQIRTLEVSVVPHGSRIKKLKGIKGTFYRLRIGDYRAIFEVQADSVTIHRIIDRKELDRVISRLKS